MNKYNIKEQIFKASGCSGVIIQAIKADWQWCITGDQTLGELI